MDEFCNKNMIYVLFGKNIHEFYDYIMSHNMPYFVLWMNSKYIINHFELDKLVYMKWNKGLYYAYKYRVSRNASDNQYEQELEPTPENDSNVLSESQSAVSTDTSDQSVENQVESQIEEILQSVE
jgi:hypothetical protein